MIYGRFWRKWMLNVKIWQTSLWKKNGWRQIHFLKSWKHHSSFYIVLLLQFNVDSTPLCQRNSATLKIDYGSTSTHDVESTWSISVGSNTKNQTLISISCRCWLSPLPHHWNNVVALAGIIVPSYWSSFPIYDLNYNIDILELCLRLNYFLLQLSNYHMFDHVVYIY